MREKKPLKSNKRTKNRAVLALLLACLIMCMTPDVMAGKRVRKTSGTFEGTKWSYNTRTKTLTLSCKGKMDDILVRYYGDTWPWEEWAYEEDGFSVEKLVIKEGVTYIGYNLTAVCFYLKYISLPNSLRRIGYNSLSYNEVTRITLPPNLEIIEGNAFCDTKIKELIIPETVTRIDRAAFASCRKLTRVQLPKKLTKISGRLFRRCSSLKTVTIPSGVTRIESEAFSRSGLTAITIPKKVEDIKSYAFSECKSLKKVTFQTNKLNIINTALFYDCEKLKSLTLPGNITEIKKWAFKESGLTTITIPKKVMKIEKEAFKSCGNLKKVTFQTNKLTRISASLFEGCKKLTTITLPDSVTKLKEKAFKGSGLTTVTIPEKVTVIGEEGFANCKDLKEVIFSGSQITSIGSNAFLNISEDCVFKVPAGQAETMKAMLSASGRGESVTVEEYEKAGI